MKKNNKGFTVLNLLIVLAVVGLILFIINYVVTGMVLTKVSDSKKQKAETITLQYIGKVNDYINLQTFGFDEYSYSLKTGIYDVDGNNKNQKYLNDIINASEKPKEGWVYIKNNEVFEYSLKFDFCTVSKINDKKTIDFSDIMSKPKGVKTIVISDDDSLYEDDDYNYDEDKDESDEEDEYNDEYYDY